MSRNTIEVTTRAQNRDRVVRYIREQREGRGWSRGYLAQATGIPYPTIYNLECRQSLPTTNTTDRIARALGVHPNVLRQLAGHELLPDTPPLPEPLDMPHELELMRKVLQELPPPLEAFARKMLIQQAQYYEDCGARWEKHRQEIEEGIHRLLGKDDPEEPEVAV